MTPRFDKLVEENWKAWLAAAGMLGGGVNADARYNDNNPGNIRNSKTTKWTGENTPAKQKGGFESFKSMEYGVRALGKNLITYQQKYKLSTISEIITKWAPPKENNTALYIQNVSKWTGIKADTKLNLSDRATLKRIIVAIIRMEVGKTLPDKTIEGGLNLIKFQVKPAKTGKIVVYTIKSGDNVSTIASRHKTTVKAIQQANPQIKDINKIFPDQKINIPQ